MAKRTNYSRASLKSKPISIRYNIRDFDAACEISGKKTVQSMFDFLLQRYLVEKGERFVSAIDRIDARLIDPLIYQNQPLEWKNQKEIVNKLSSKSEEKKPDTYNEIIIVEKGGFQIRIEVKKSLGDTQ